MDRTKPPLAGESMPRRSFTALTAAPAFTSPAPEPGWLGSLVAVRMRMPFT